MADDQQGAVIGPKASLHGGDGIDIEMVRRLIKDQQLRRLRASQNTGETCPEHLPARECCNDLQGGIGTKHEACERGAAGILPGLRVKTKEVVADGQARVEQADLLVEKHGLHPNMHRPFEWR